MRNLTDTTHRRAFLRRVAAAFATASWRLSKVCCAQAAAEALIIDTHQHLWDLSWQKLPWLNDAPEVLRHTYGTPEYRKAVADLNMRAVYMEVDVDPSQHVAEAEHVIQLCRDPDHPTIAAVIGGRPASGGFAKYVARFKDTPEVRGVRQVLHNPATPAGYCLTPEFVAGIRSLGEAGLSFDLCMRPTELDDARKLTELCPETRFVVDHCGNADPAAFLPAKLRGKQPGHDADAWRRSMAQLAERPNTICKISGIIARAPEGWKAEDLAPIVHHCLEVFGPDRVVFGGDWPVCLLGDTLRAWIDALGEIVQSRPAEEREKLWSANAIKFYGLKI